MPRRKSPAGQINRLKVRIDPPKKKPENRIVSGALITDQTRVGLVFTFFHPDCYRRPRNYTVSCVESLEPRSWALPPVGNCTLPRRLIIQLARLYRYQVRESNKLRKNQETHIRGFLINCCDDYALRMASSATGQTATHCGASKCPSHSTHVAGSIT